MRILLVTPHLSTGGLPQYLLYKLQVLLSKKMNVYVYEHKCLSPEYVVQRNKIRDLIGDKFISEKPIVSVVQQIKPDIIHFEEFAETFITDNELEQISKMKTKIYETSHGSHFDPKQKKFFPNAFVFVTQYHVDMYKEMYPDIPCYLAKYPIIYQSRANRNYNLMNLDLDPTKKHILNVGLFTPNKNQGYMMEIAKNFLDNNTQFHFVGNMAPNFKEYWQPLMDNLLINCKVWGERSDIDTFYSAMDVLFFPSKLETNPLVVREALGYDLPILMFDLPIYGGEYSKYNNINFLSGNIDEDLSKLKNILVAEDSLDNILDIYDNKISLQPVVSLNDKFVYSFVDGPKCEIFGNSKSEYDINFIANNEVFWRDRIKTNNWTKSYRQYYTDWNIEVFKNNKLVDSHKFDLNGKKVLIGFESKSLGDTLAWIPYVEEFRKKQNCKVVLSTFHNNIFDYQDIEFVSPGTVVNNLYALYRIGCWENDLFKNKVDWRTVPVQKVASDILGLEYTEIMPKLKFTPKERIEDKYVTISEFSTLQAKFWNYPGGWQQVVDYINSMGLKVMVISSEKTTLKSVIDETGRDINTTINNIFHGEFHIGVSAGPSWIAWALRKPVVMISGCSDKITEFISNNIRIINEDVCHGCINSVDNNFDRGQWLWCPKQKDFECTKSIPPEIVIKELQCLFKK